MQDEITQKKKTELSRSKVYLSILFFLLFVGYLFLVMYVRSKQKAVFFQPDYDLVSGPPQDFIHGKYKGIIYWYMDKLPERPTILYFHGSSGNISYNEPLVHFAKKYDYNLFLMDYRGYGEAAKVESNTSQKKKKKVITHQPTEASLYEDGQNAYDFLAKEKKIDPTKIIVWGTSLGGLAASWVAAKNKIGLLVLWATFANPTAILDAYEGKDVSAADRIIYRSVKPFVYKMNIQSNLSKVRAPTVILHAKTDELISYENALLNFKQLSKNLPPDKLKFIDIGGLHSKPVLTADMWHQLLDFLEEFQS